MKRRKKKNYSLLLIIGGALLLLTVAAALLLDRLNVGRTASNDSPTADIMGTITVNGKSHRLNPDIKTILFVGVDNMGAMENSGFYLNDGQADFLMVALVNDKEQSYSLLHINRDTMTDVTVLGLNGRKAGTDIMQIALSHNYGSGLEDSCRNTREAVSGLLFGSGIDRYFAMNMDGVAVLNDSVGGVTLECLDDFEGIPEFRKGNTITLMGDDALTYVRARMSAGDGTNLSRMERQRQYIDKFLEKFMDDADSESFALSTFESIAEYLVSDMTINELSKLANKLSEYTCTGIESIKGEAVVGAENFIEFYPDDAALAEQVIRLFCVG